MDTQKPTKYTMTDAEARLSHNLETAGLLAQLLIKALEQSVDVDLFNEADRLDDLLAERLGYGTWTVMKQRIGDMLALPKGTEIPSTQPLKDCCEMVIALGADYLQPGKVDALVSAFQLDRVPKSDQKRLWRGMVMECLEAAGAIDMLEQHGEVHATTV